MPEIKILPIFISITIALIFFILGRLMVVWFGNAGIWIVAIILILFYALWWLSYRRGKPK